MATLTIRNVGQTTHARLRERAARNGRSVEAEVRDILDAAVEAPTQNILLELHERLGGSIDDDFEFLPRESEPRDVDLP